MYNFSDEQNELRSMVKKFATENMEGCKANEGIEEENFLIGLKMAGKLGYFGMTTPDEYNGNKMDLVSSTIVVNELAKVNASFGHIVSSANYTYCYPLAVYGTEEQKEKYLKNVATGKETGALACTEPETDCKTVFKEEDNKIILNGVKSYVTLGKIADYALVQATNSLEGPEFNRLTFLLVELKKENGVKVSNVEGLMGMNQIGLVEVSFHNTVLTKDCILGEINGGGQILMDLCGLMKLGDATVALGLAERAYQEALNYMRIRKYGDVAIINMQSVQFELAQYKTELCAMELMTYQVAKNIETNPSNSFEETTMLKLFVTEKAKQICDGCLQMFGGSGYVKGNIIERIYRDVRAMSITGGHLAAMKSMISMNLDWK